MNSRTKKSSRSGQSIIEAIVAISILTTGLLGVMTLLTKSFELNRVTSDDTKATYLASENIEVVKNLIDHDVYTGIASGVAGWGSCFPYPAMHYEIDYETYDCATIPISHATSSVPIYFSSNTGLYSDSSIGVGVTKTIFTRDTYVVNNGNEIEVQSTVYWSPEPGDSQSITLEDHFYNWYPTTD